MCRPPLFFRFKEPFCNSGFFLALFTMTSSFPFRQPSTQISLFSTRSSGWNSQIQLFLPRMRGPPALPAVFRRLAFLVLFPAIFQERGLLHFPFPMSFSLSLSKLQTPPPVAFWSFFDSARPSCQERRLQVVTVPLSTLCRPCHVGVTLFLIPSVIFPFKFLTSSPSSTELSLRKGILASKGIFASAESKIHMAP